MQPHVGTRETTGVVYVGFNIILDDSTRLRFGHGWTCRLLTERRNKFGRCDAGRLRKNPRKNITVGKATVRRHISDGVVTPQGTRQKLILHVDDSEIIDIGLKITPFIFINDCRKIRSIGMQLFRYLHKTDAFFKVKMFLLQPNEALPDLHHKFFSRFGAFLFCSFGKAVATVLVEAAIWAF